ncbi:DUF397 domain-containing protein [Streptomyces sp. NBC_01262]|uniref:DUF397 domain-containing protein n=1 Tax=Streptomyces sp. NBC_01262 TaxID=2903803 RepID=UPI002E335A27|nr:DUF397 domain-containing protein [Streptomyces sp. NBC_01262]
MGAHGPHRRSLTRGRWPFLASCTACEEEMAQLVWRKSSFSGGSNGDFIEVATGTDGLVHLRPPRRDRDHHASEAGRFRKGRQGGGVRPLIRRRRMGGGDDW